jgi:transposase
MTYQEPAVATLLERLTALTPTLIGVEATGDLEMPVVRALAPAGLPVSK